MTTPAPERRYRINPTRAGRAPEEPGRQAVVGPRRDYGLGRHVRHDPRSRRYAFRAPARATLAPVRHARRIPIFDQGDLGSCVGETAIGVLGTEPYLSAYQSLIREGWPSDRPLYPLTQAGAVQFYSDVTQSDPFDGAYPPDDTGSDGLSAAKLLTAQGIVPGYTHTFSIADALAALQHFPLMVGTVWTEGMFTPSAAGVVRPTGAIVGGHEYIADEYVPAGGALPSGGKVAAETVGFTTSWGEGFGVAGRFYMTAANFAKLLGQDGDVIVLAPPTAPAPEPEPELPPPSTADEALAAAMRAWLSAKGL